MIPDEAVQAAHQAWREQAALDGSIFEYNLRAALEAAAPHMLSHEREETRLAHLDAVVNAGTLSKHEALVDELRYVADNKTADNAIGRWWGGVIRGAIDRHLGSQP